MIKNPILPGFNPDPSICRKGDDFYIAVSTFEWMPGIPVYHSRDLKNWELYTHVLTDDRVDLRKLPSAKGIWAPCLTYCEKEDKFYVIYGVMNNMNARYFDVDNYLITADDIMGPWSDPVYLHSAGFDASILHDDDGRKYIVSLEWEVRDGYEKPGVICLAEYDPSEKKIVDYPKRIWRGGTDRGCIEAPHLTKRNGYYYLMCAEGGTGYNHCTTMARAGDVWGPYEGDPKNPIITSQPVSENERHDPDHLKPKYYNPETLLQKAGHASYVETKEGEVYAVHLCSRPFVTDSTDLREKYRCTLGRETAIQKMIWTDDGWLRMADGSNIARENTQESSLPECRLEKDTTRDVFSLGKLPLHFYSPRMMPDSFVSFNKIDGTLGIRGQEAPTSLNRVSFLARKLTSVHGQVTTKMQFSPLVYQHSAGLMMYYDNMNFVYLRKYYSQTLKGAALSIIKLENGDRTEYVDTRTAVSSEASVWMRVVIEGEKYHFLYSLNGEDYSRIGEDFDTTKLSDEYCKYGEFTGAFVGMVCVDRMFHEKCAYFDFFEYIDK